MTPQRGDESSAEAEEDTPVPPREARRVMKARREHSKGDGNFPAPEPSPQLVDDERPEDRMPRDLPKSRDDRSAPKGNITAGQDDRNPNLETRDDQRPGPPSRAFSLDAARDAAAMPNAAPRPRPIAEAKRAGSTAGQVKDAPGRAGESREAEEPSERRRCRNQRAQTVTKERERDRAPRNERVASTNARRTWRSEGRRDIARRRKRAPPIAPPRSARCPSAVGTKRRCAQRESDEARERRGGRASHEPLHASGPDARSRAQRSR